MELNILIKLLEEKKYEAIKIALKQNDLLCGGSLGLAVPLPFIIQKVSAVRCKKTDITKRRKYEKNKRSDRKIYGCHCTCGGCACAFCAAKLPLDTDGLDKLSFDDSYVRYGTDDEIERSYGRVLAAERCYHRLCGTVFDNAAACVFAWKAVRS